MEIKRLSSIEINFYWRWIEPWLEKALSDDLYNTDDIKAKVLSGDMQCWGRVNDIEIAAFAITSVQEYPRTRIGYIHYNGGKNMKKWLHDGLVVLADFFKEFGCRSYINACPRKGYLRYLKFDRHTTYYEKDL